MRRPPTRPTLGCLSWNDRRMKAYLSVVVSQNPRRCISLNVRPAFVWVDRDDVIKIAYAQTVLL